MNYLLVQQTCPPEIDKGGLKYISADEAVIWRIDMECQLQLTVKCSHWKSDILSSSATGEATRVKRVYK